MEGVDPAADEDEEMPYDEEDDEGIEEDLDDDGTLGLDRLQVHTVELGEAAAAEAEPAQPLPGSSATPPSASAQPDRSACRPQILVFVNQLCQILPRPC